VILCVAALGVNQIASNIRVQVNTLIVFWLRPAWIKGLGATN
jgi:hypothetical protein